MVTPSFQATPPRRNYAARAGQWWAVTTTDPDDAWRFPWSPNAFIATTLLWAATMAALVPAQLAR